MTRLFRVSSAMICLLILPFSLFAQGSGCYRIGVATCQQCYSLNGPYQGAPTNCRACPTCDIVNQGAGNEQGYCTCQVWLVVSPGSVTMPQNCPNPGTELNSCRNAYKAKTQPDGVTVVGTRCGAYGPCGNGCHRTMVQYTDPDGNIVEAPISDWHCGSSTGSPRAYYECTNFELTGNDC